MDDSGTVGGDVIEPKLFGFVIDGDVIDWGTKGRFATGKVPIKELGAGVSDESCFVISSGEDIFLKGGKVVPEWEAASEGSD